MWPTSGYIQKCPWKLAAVDFSKIRAWEVLQRSAAACGCFPGWPNERPLQTPQPPTASLMHLLCHAAEGKVRLKVWEPVPYMAPVLASLLKLLQSERTGTVGQPRWQTARWQVPAHVVLSLTLPEHRSFIFLTTLSAEKEDEASRQSISWLHSGDCNLAALLDAMSVHKLQLNSHLIYAVLLINNWV